MQKWGPPASFKGLNTCENVHVLLIGRKQNQMS